MKGSRSGMARYKFTFEEQVQGKWIAKSFTCLEHQVEMHNKNLKQSASVQLVRNVKLQFVEQCK